MASNGIPLQVVIGAFGFSGSRISRRLLDAGVRVRTLTNAQRPEHPLYGRIDARPLAFANTRALIESLRGAAVLYNTYWVRFNHRNFTFAQAVANSGRLFQAARSAGVGRIVHVSITNPSLESPFEYFRGKAQVEAALRESGVPHTILRPAVLFGEGDILINNIAWALRTFPIFGVFGDGNYRLQPIFVDDFAELAVAAGGQAGEWTIDAIGPDAFTYRGLAEMLRDAMGVATPIVSVSPAVGYTVSRLAGFFLGDIILTREEIGALMADLLCTDSPPSGSTRLSDWVRTRTEVLGRSYASELGRR